MNIFLLTSLLLCCLLHIVLPLPISSITPQPTTLDITTLKPTTPQSTTLQTTTLQPITSDRKKIKQCQVEDAEDTGIDKRYTITGKWKNNQLNYRINSYPSQTIKIATRADVDFQIATAFKDWSDVADLTFTRTQAQNADVVIDFARLDHGDNTPFDGPGGVYGHAYSPEDGRVHMDDDETWSYDSYDGINLRQLMAHEIGHMLGLRHSKVKSSVMFKSHIYMPVFRFHQDDVETIAFLYGKKKTPNNYLKPFPTPVDILNVQNTPQPNHLPNNLLPTPLPKKLPQTPSPLQTTPSIDDPNWYNWYLHNIG